MFFYFQAALIGAFSGLFIMTYLSLKSQTEIATGALHIATKPLSTEGCTYDFVHSTVNTTIVPEIVEQSKSLHHISYLYYTGFGAAITCIVGFIFTLILGKRDPRTVDPSLLAPFIRKYYKKESVDSSQIEKEQVCLHHEFELKDNQISS